MKHKKLIAVTIALTISVLTGSNVMAHGGGGGGHGGFGVGSGFHGGRFSGGGFRGDLFRHRNFNDRFFFFGDFGDSFFYYPYPYYGSYPYDDYPYNYGYDSYNQPGYRVSAGYTASLVRQVQFCLARAGYYRGSIDGVSGKGDAEGDPRI